MQDLMLDDIDQRLLHALQIEPRSSWSDLAPLIGADAATLSRRWSRLHDQGIAWITGYRPPQHAALIEIECAPTQTAVTERELRQDPAVLVLDYCSGSRDLLALVNFDSLASLSDYTLHRLGQLSGISSVRTHLMIEILVEGMNWRLRALTPDEAARVRPARPPRARAAHHVHDDLRRAIEIETWKDGRASVAMIARQHNFSAQRVSDAIATLRRSGHLRFRTDIARAATGWPIYTWYFVEAPASVVLAARTAIAKVPEVRLAFTASSRYNLILAVWLRGLTEVTRFEYALEKALAGARIADRSVVLRISKHLGQIIGEDTRAIVEPPTSTPDPARSEMQPNPG
jgi:DNA-binding Lrp family transcriptional regulator